MSSNKWIRPVSFNRTNPADQARLELIGRKSFSKFVKKLLDEEIARRELKVSENNNEVKLGVEPEAEKNTEETPKNEIKPITTADKLEQLKKRRSSKSSNIAPRLFVNQPKS